MPLLVSGLLPAGSLEEVEFLVERLEQQHLVELERDQHGIPVRVRLTDAGVVDVIERLPQLARRAAGG